MAGERFKSNEEVTVAVDGYFANPPESHFRDGIYLLGKRWIKCIEVKGDYIKK